MTTLTIKPGGVIRSDYPPRSVFVDFWNGEATILQLDNPDECLDDAIKQADHLRKVHKAMRKRLDSNSEKV